jgi:DNA-binding SARP family transcriptional activator
VGSFVFLEKVRRPEPSGLRRDRLEGPLLDETGPAITLVLAPAGSGKTTLLTRVAAACPAAVAWYRAGPDDNSEAAVVRHVATAISIALQRDLPHIVAIDELIRTAETYAQQPLSLVVDDVHELAASPGEQALERFVELRPRSIRMLLGSRRPLGLNTPRLLVSGDLRQLDGESLRFRSWEVEELFRSIYEEPLPPEAAAALTQRTGGWAAGLQLFHLATTGKSYSERVRAVSDLDGRSQLIRSYLTRNVLEELPPDLREFLLMTSTLGILTGPLCDALLQRHGSVTVLDDLERHQFFTTSTGDGRSYRYHQVLHSHLEGLLIDEIGPTASRALHARSASLLEDAGHEREAMRAYALADDWASVARLLQHSTAEMPVTECGWTTWSALPDDDPWLALVRARRLFRSGSITAAMSAYRWAESLLDDPDFRARCVDERTLAAIWSRERLAARMRSAEIGDPTRSMAETIRWAVRRIPDTFSQPNPADRELGLAAGVVYLLAGRLPDARDALTPVAAAVADPSWTRTFAKLALVVVDLAEDCWSDAVGPLEEVILSAEVEEQPWLARLARAIQAITLLTTRPDPWRADVCASLADDCARGGDDWGALLVRLLTGAAQLKMGDDEAAEEWLASAASVASALDAPVLEAWAASLGVVAAARLQRTGISSSVARVGALIRATGLYGAHQLLEHAHQLRGPPTATAGVVREVPIHDGRRVRLSCLGGFRVEADGVAVEFPPLRPRAWSLLLLLSINYGRDVHWERLIEALWPDAPVAAGTHRLQVAASHARQCLATAGLGGDTLRRHGDAYRLELDLASFDVAEFENALRNAASSVAAGDIESALRSATVALELYTGELLPEVGPAEWVLAERDRLGLAAADVAVRIAEWNQQLGRAGDALSAAQRAVALDPWRDTSWMLLADAQEALGDQTAAAATRRKHERVCAALGLPV